jgi:23S rRNA (cytidine1920-2'-O)/16S rRNA (cytidine1409-2'-O)-methyltransferase
VPRRRLDAELVRRGLAPSRTAAQQVVRAGKVTVGGVPATKAATLVADDAPVQVTDVVRPYVSRGGGKLAAALDRFSIDVAGMRCLDAGASTGGFTDCLLQRGAAHVVAVDVGYGQLAWELRSDPRVDVRERTNIRAVTAADLGRPLDLVVVDLAFVSLRVVLPALEALGAPRYVLLVKPQFEAGPADVSRGGVVGNPDVWRRVLGDVVADAEALGLKPVGVMTSPLPGPAGNVEFLLAVERGGPTMALDLDAALAEGEALRA